MDALEVRLGLLGLLRGVTASAGTQAAVSSYIVHQPARVRGDVWECITTFLARAGGGGVDILGVLSDEVVVHLGDVFSAAEVVALLLPPGRWIGLLALQPLLSALERWEALGVPVQQARSDLRTREAQLRALHRPEVPRDTLIRRIEDDRERHKRSREAAWSAPPLPLFSPLPSLSPQFQHEYDATSDYNSDD